MWPTDLALFVYILTHYVETVEYLDFNRHIQLGQWLRGNTLDWSMRGPGFNSQLWQEYLHILLFRFVVVFLFFVQKTLFT